MFSVLISVLLASVGSTSDLSAQVAPPQPVRSGESNIPSGDRIDLEEISVRVSNRAAKLGFAKLRTPEQYFHAIWTLEADVNNGGFDQYFFNSSGDYAAVAAVALRSIGAHKVAALVATACKVFGDGGPPKDRARRQVAMAKLPARAQETWKDQDKKFFAYPDNIAALLDAYVAAKRDSFK